MTEKHCEPISEDTLQCCIYSSVPRIDWQNLCEAVNMTIKTLSSGYLWHKDEFKVFLPISGTEGNDCNMYLIGTTCYGDNVEDEWFIVYILLEISKQYTDLIIKVGDNDGDFLLIEAANYLPSWANPETTENRVFIYNKHIHLIPNIIADVDSELTVGDAIKLIVQCEEQTKASSEIQQAITRRIDRYPDKVNEHIHRAIVNLPLNIAALLKVNPSLIAPIVTSYCNLDIIDAKHCKNINFENCVNAEIKFTKCLYAMLLHSKLINKCNRNTSQEDKKNVLGIKLTCGYHIIMSNRHTNIFNTEEYNKFINNLKKIGYFNGNTENSKEYSRLLENANNFYSDKELPVNFKVCDIITKTMLTPEFDKAKDSLKDELSEASIIDDKDDWLNIQPEQLDDLLNTRYGKHVKFKHDVLTAQTIASELSNFLNHTSGFEGIEPIEVEESNDIDFNCGEFVDDINKMLDLISSENCENIVSSDSNSDSEEHRHVKFYNNSDMYEENVNRSQSNKLISRNMIQSVKEEQGSSGPSSNILMSIGIRKTDVLDSDDDD